MFSFLKYIPSFLSLFPLILLAFPCLVPARPLRPDTTAELTVITAGNATWQWRDFSRLTNSEKGSHVSGMSDLKRYFHRFGYFSTLQSNYSSGNFTDLFDGEMEMAVLAYQRKMGLNVTGRLDHDTISTLMAPRCGMGDGDDHDHERHSYYHSTRHYAYFNGTPTWARPGPITLTYAVSTVHTIDNLSHAEIRAVFRRAFARWAAVIPVSFEETQDEVMADVRVGFYRGDHGDGEPFDGVLGVLAHAFSPEDGRLHLDAAETWAVDFGREKTVTAVDLESVATHEIGHVLGLAHSSVKEAVMYPSVKPRTKKVDLSVDDVEGVQALYGSNPNFKYGSLLQTESSANRAIGLRSDWTPTLALLLGLLVCVMNL